jgi:hypothetical protein
MGLDDILGLISRVLTSWGHAAGLDHFVNIALRAIAVGAIIAGFRKLFRWSFEKIKRGILPLSEACLVPTAREISNL